MGLFNRTPQEPSEAYAAEEQHRAADPTNPSQASLPHYRAAYQNASGNAAQNTAQPKRKW